MNVGESNTDVSEYITYHFQLDEERGNSKICVLYFVFQILGKKFNSGTLVLVFEVSMLNYIRH